MSEHIATLDWQRGDAPFDYRSYSRNHTWDFGHGVTLRASAAPDYLGDKELVDPEQAFVASLSSCHMLTFLALAATRKLTVDRYSDRAVGLLAKNEAGKVVVSRVDLHPKVVFAGETPPERATLEELHHVAHQECFLANSVTCNIVTHIVD